jgi:hypothetical protein
MLKINIAFSLNPYFNAGYLTKNPIGLPMGF